MTAENLKNRLRRHPLIFSSARQGLYIFRALYGRAHAMFQSKINWARYQKKYTVRKLHLGCGDLLLEGWFNTDGYPRRAGVSWCDATREFPFPDDSFDYIFTEHMIEHISFQAAKRMLDQCFRVIKPGGRIRISTPNLDKLLALKRKPLSALETAYLDYALDQIPDGFPGYASFAINSMMRNWGHTFIYDAETLSHLLKTCGFDMISVVDVSQSSDPHLENLEHHGEIFPNPEFNLVESMVFEATRPVGSAC